MMGEEEERKVEGKEGISGRLVHGGVNACPKVLDA